MVRRFKLILLALFCFVAAGQFAWTAVQAQDPPAEKFFKNIQALKGVPTSKIAGLMNDYTTALGVSCAYCHVEGDLAKADKPAHKLAVRDIQMTREINEKYKHSVDCMQCHQGKAKPGIGVIAKADPEKPPTDPNKNKNDKPPTDPIKPKVPEAAPPTKVSYLGGSMGKVLFPHDTHMNMDCAKCHHTGENSKCDACHLHNRKASAATQVTFYSVAHGAKSERACAGCHTQIKTGPTTCVACHKK